VSAPGLTVTQTTGISWSSFDKATGAMAAEFDIRQVTTTCPESGPDDMIVQVHLVRRVRQR
jgi:hypothetical protein